MSPWGGFLAFPPIPARVPARVLIHRRCVLSVIPRHVFSLGTPACLGWAEDGAELPAAIRTAASVMARGRSAPGYLWRGVVPGVAAPRLAQRSCGRAPTARGPQPPLPRSSPQALGSQGDAEPCKARLGAPRSASASALANEGFAFCPALLFYESAVENLSVSPNGGRSLQRTSRAGGSGVLQAPEPSFALGCSWDVYGTRGRVVLQNREQQASRGGALQHKHIRCDSRCTAISSLDFFVNYLKCRNCKQKPGWFCCVHRLD